MTPLGERGADSVAEVWNASVPSKYRIDGSLVDANLLRHPLLHAEASLWDGDTFVAVKRSAAELYKGPNAKVAHLSFLGGGELDQPNARDLPTRALRQAIEILRDEGFDALVVGQDSGHFLPGAPTDVPWLGWFLKEAGFERGGLAFDLERDLQTFPNRTENASPTADFRPLGEGDVGSLDQFLRREFPGRWHYDVMRKVEAEGPPTVYGLILENAVQGFALIQQDGCRLPIGGAVWRADLGQAWGSLGPIGVSRNLRGQSLGVGLLHAALTELRERGARRTIIDWTELIDFYGTQGFSPARSYRSYRLNLRADQESGA